MRNLLLRIYLVEGDSLVPILAAVEENVTCSLQKLEDENVISGFHGDTLSYLTMTTIIKCNQRDVTLTLRAIFSVCIIIRMVNIQ